jgi:PmbA protein
MINEIEKKIKKQVDAFEILQITEDSHDIVFKNKLLNKIDTVHNTASSLRVIINGKIGSAFISNENQIDFLTQNAIDASNFGSRVLFDFPKEKINYTKSFFDDDLNNLTIDEFIKEATRIIDIVKLFDPKINTDIFISRKTIHTHLRNSSNHDAKSSKTIYKVSLMFPLESSVYGITKTIAKNKFLEFPAEDINEMIEDYKFSKIPVSISTKKIPVLFKFGSIWSLMWRLALAVSGNNIVKKLSPLENKISERIFHENLNIIDDPLMEDSIYSRLFDDEGVSTKTKNIIKNGKLENLVYDLDSASKLNKESCGNGLKYEWFSNNNISSKINAWPVNIVIESGKSKNADIVKNMPEGLILLLPLGAHSGNLIAGEYSMNVGIGFYVKNGRIQGRLQDAMISGNIYEDLKNVRDISNELNIANFGYYPDILIDNVNVIAR